MPEKNIAVIGAHIFVSWLNPFKEQKLVIVGGNGMLVFDDTEPGETDRLDVCLL